MSKTTIENSSKGYVLRCETCGEAYELATVDRSMPLWAFKALVKGFEDEHSVCSTTLANLSLVAGPAKPMPRMPGNIVAGREKPRGW